MKEKPDTTGDNRNPDGTFKVGVSGNPNGRPKGSSSIKDILRKIGMEDGTEDGLPKLEVIMRKVFIEAVDGKPWAVQFLADRLEGKPREFVEQKIVKDELIIE